MTSYKFWNHSKQHSSKTEDAIKTLKSRFWNHSKQHSSKTNPKGKISVRSFGTIRNSTALKLVTFVNHSTRSFGTIRNSTALKPRRKIFLTKFRNRAIRPSQTSVRLIPIVTLIIPYFQDSRNSLDPAHTAENHRLFEVQQIRLLVD